MIRHPHTRTLTALAAAPILLLGAGCTAAGTTADGPAEVSVVKKPLPTPTGNQDDLARFDPEQTPGAADIDWGSTLEHVWLPSAAEVTEGIDGTTATAGTVYLTVPAAFEVTDAAVRDHQDRDTLSSYTAVEVTEDQATEPGATGTVIDAVADGVHYALTVAPDPDRRDGFSVVMVMWNPDTTVSVPETTPASSQPDIPADRG